VDDLREAEQVGGAGERPPQGIAIAWEVTQAPLDEGELRRIACAALSHGGRAEQELSLVLLDDAALCELHERYLGDPSPTDVISFDLGEDGGPIGEVCVSVERAQLVAAERGVRPARELALYVVHGVLHLCGFDDTSDEERARMRAAEGAVMSALGYEQDCAPHESPE